MKCKLHTLAGDAGILLLMSTKVTLETWYNQMLLKFRQHIEYFYDTTKNVWGGVVKISQDIG